MKGELYPGPVTIARIGGAEMDSFYAFEGTAIPADPVPNQCRTQVRVRIPELARQLRQAPLGNHHAIVPGSLAEAFHATMKLMGIRKVLLRNR